MDIKLKYYLRGMGIGIILTALVMGFALGGRKAAISDAQVIERAKALGMVEGKGVLSQTSNEAGDSNEASEIASSKALAQTGAEIFEKIDETVPSSGEFVSGLGQTTEQGAKEEEAKASESTDESSQEAEEIAKAKAAEEAEAAKKAEEEKKAQEAAKKAEEEKAAQEAAKKAEEEKKAQEAAKKAEEEKAAQEAARKAAEEEKKAQEAKAAEEAAKKAEEERKAQEAAKQAASSFKTSETKTITIPGGTGSEGVAALLYREGLVDNAANFNKYLVDSRKDRVIRSGVKTIPAGSGYAEIAAIITK